MVDVQAIAKVRIYNDIIFIARGTYIDYNQKGGGYAINQVCINAFYFCMRDSTMQNFDEQWINEFNVVGKNRFSINQSLTINSRSLLTDSLHSLAPLTGFTYPVSRHKLPANASRISASVGLPFSRYNASIDNIIAGVV